MNIHETITQLSHEFGTADYVRGGGGNTSCKDEHTLWVKPSGTTLANLTVDSFVAIDRAKLAELYRIEPPSDSSGREALIKEMMERAVLTATPRRASVEAPLHDSLQARYVVHTHPFIVNGMTCSKNGKTACNELFPSALWLDYSDPGYMLCMKVRDQIKHYKDQNGSEPSLIFLKNHGVFIADDEADGIRELYAKVMSGLKSRFEKAGISPTLEIAQQPEQGVIESAKKVICETMHDPDLSVAASGAFKVPSGPISPDHIVYAKSYPLIGRPTVESVLDFQNKHGYVPQVLSFDNAVLGVAATEKKAILALELAQDGALVEKLAAAFGGIDYMTDAAREFIENWEVESYRQKQM